MDTQKELIEATSNLIAMAQRREHVMGDASALLAAKTNLATAAIRCQIALRNFLLFS
jgi:hypothetical protein